jgi:hypothetical protein
MPACHRQSNSFSGKRKTPLAGSLPGSRLLDLLSWRYVRATSKAAAVLIAGCLVIFSPLTLAAQETNEALAQTSMTIFQHSVDISKLKASGFKMTVHMRVKGNNPEAYAIIGASCTDAEGNPYFFDDMGETPCNSDEWKQYTVEGEFEQPIDKLNLLALCNSEGSFYFDEFQLFTRTKNTGKWKAVKMANGGFETGFPGSGSPAWEVLLGEEYYVYEAENKNAVKGKNCLHILGENIPENVVEGGLMTGESPLSTRADSLRGTLTPVRTCYDVTYYHLNTRINPADRTIKGYNDIQFRVVSPTRRIQVDLFDNLKVDNITWKGATLPYTREANAVFIDFPEELKAGATETIRFGYSGKPREAINPPWDGGLSWKKDSKGDDWVAVSCQGLGASVWWPNKDHQTEEPDSMLISIEVPSALMDISNGRLRSSEDLGDGFTRYNWFVANPINNYDVTFNIGKYAHFGDKHNDLTLDYYVLPENLEKAKKHFQQVKPMMTCFEKIFGPYPFYEDGYKLVETPYLGMEHQSAVAYGNKYLNGYLGSGISSAPVSLKWDYIIIHESGHEWFGNNITTEDIADMWVHEGFTTYSECIYVECEYGYQEYLNYVNGLKYGIGNQAPIIGNYGVNKEGAGDMYPKGALLLHTVRSIIDDDAKWFSILKGLNTDFRHDIVTSAEVEDYIIKKSGKDLSKVFDQYLRHAALPQFQLREEGGKVQFRWRADVEGFDMPVKASIKGKAAEWIKPTTEWQTLPGVESKADLKIATDLFYFGFEGA